MLRYGVADAELFRGDLTLWLRGFRAQLLWWLLSSIVTLAAATSHAPQASLTRVAAYCLVWFFWGLLLSSGLLILVWKLRFLERLSLAYSFYMLVVCTGASLAFFAIMYPLAVAQTEQLPHAGGLLIFSWVTFLAWGVSVFSLAASERARRAEALALRLKVEVAESELRGLRQQVNSHLVFNALNSILGAVEEASPRAPQMVLDLSSLLRLSLGRTEMQGSLGQELERLELFARIVRARFEESLELTIEVPSELLEFRCLSLSVQTLVENAVKHGCAPQDAPLQVKVVALREADCIVVQVTNDGILQGIEDQARGTGFGVSSVRKRLREQYGVHAFLHYVERRDVRKGVVVAIMRWPLERFTPSLQQGKES